MINIIITILDRKYSRLKQSENKTFDLGNDSGISITPGSFMPRLPFLILRKVKESRLRKIIIAHNSLCVVVYLLFAFASLFDYL